MIPPPPLGGGSGWLGPTGPPPFLGLLGFRRKPAGGKMTLFLAEKRLDKKGSPVHSRWVPPSSPTRQPHQAEQRDGAVPAAGQPVPRPRLPYARGVSGPTIEWRGGTTVEGKWIYVTGKKKYGLKLYFHQTWKKNIMNRKDTPQKKLGSPFTFGRDRYAAPQLYRVYFTFERWFLSSATASSSLAVQFVHIETPPIDLSHIPPIFQSPISCVHFFAGHIQQVRFDQLRSGFPRNQENILRRAGGDHGVYGRWMVDPHFCSSGGCP